MATIIEMQAALSDLSGGFTMPGLNFDTIVERIVETNPEYKTVLDTYTGDSRINQKQKMINYLSNSNSKDYINSQINIIRINFSNLNTGITQLKEGLFSATASNAMPPALAAGITPNPAYVAIENNTKKNILLTACDALVLCLSNLIQSALNIYFELPSSVMLMVSTLTNLRSSINQIP